MVYLKNDNGSAMDTQGFKIDKSNGYNDCTNDDKIVIDIIKKLFNNNIFTK